MKPSENNNKKSIPIIKWPNKYESNAIVNTWKKLLYWLYEGKIRGIADGSFSTESISSEDLKKLRMSKEEYKEAIEFLEFNKLIECKYSQTIEGAGTGEYWGLSKDGFKVVRENIILESEDIYKKLLIFFTTIMALTGIMNILSNLLLKGAKALYIFFSILYIIVIFLIGVILFYDKIKGYFQKRKNKNR